MYCEGVFEKSLDCRQEHLFGKMSMKQQAAKLYHERMMVACKCFYDTVVQIYIVLK